LRLGAAASLAATMADGNNQWSTSAILTDFAGSQY